MVDAPCSGEGMFRKEEIAIDDECAEEIDTSDSPEAETGIPDEMIESLEGFGVDVERADELITDSLAKKPCPKEERLCIHRRQREGNYKRRYFE